MYTIENEFLKITFEPRSGEIASIINKVTQTEHMWQANPNVWGWHAPILFPIVGSVKNDTLVVDGKSFPISRHGFFRTSIPDVENHSDRNIVFLLKSSDETRTQYPFEFECRIEFELNEMSLSQRFIVTNTDSKPIFFALGGHPAFKVPFFENESYADYYLEFEKSERLDRCLLTSEGLFSGEMEPVLVHGNKIPLSYDLFSKDALVFKSIESREVTIKSKNHSNSLKVSFPNFPYLGLWAKPNADFVCIEPWIGCADPSTGHKDISEKELMQDVEPGESFEAEFVISID